MKLIFLFYALALLPSVFATSLAISPDAITLTKLEESSIFLLMNPNAEGLSYSITTSSQNIIIEDVKGTLPPNTNKEIHFKTTSLSQDEYIIISSESEGSINPSITLKLVKGHNETQDTSAISQANTVETSSEPPKTSQSSALSNASAKPAQTDYTYILLSIAVILVILIFTVKPSKKHCTGRTGQPRRRFINNLIH